MILPMRTVWTLDDAEANRLLNEERLSITETARQLGVSRQAVHHAIQRGRVRVAHRAGGPRIDDMPADGTHDEDARAGSNHSTA